MLKLEVTPDEMNVLINALGQRPFAEVNVLLNKLVNQANSSLLAANQPVPELPPEA